MCPFKKDFVAMHVTSHSYIFLLVILLRIEIQSLLESLRDLLDIPLLCIVTVYFVIYDRKQTPVICR